MKMKVELTDDQMLTIMKALNESMKIHKTDSFHMNYDSLKETSDYISGRFSYLTGKVYNPETFMFSTFEGKTVVSDLKETSDGIQL